ARGDDRLVGSYQVLRRAVLYCTLAFRRKRVVRLEVQAHAGKSLRLHRLAVLQVSICRRARQPVIAGELRARARAHELVERVLAAERENIFPVAGIVDRHVPVNGVDRAHASTTGDSSVRHYEGGDAQITLVAPGTA